MKTYCIKCNQPTEYLSDKPKFCSNCGYNFSSISIDKSSINIKPTNDKNDAIDNDEEYSEIQTTIQNVSPFKIEKLINVKNTEKLGNLALDTSEKIILPKTKKKKISNKEFKKQWEETLSKKPSINIGGE